jgi:hypothetical protein
MDYQLGNATNEVIGYPRAVITIFWKLIVSIIFPITTFSHVAVNLTCPHTRQEEI